MLLEFTKHYYFLLPRGKSVNRWTHSKDLRELFWILRLRVIATIGCKMTWFNNTDLPAYPRQQESVLIKPHLYQHGQGKGASKNILAHRKMCCTDGTTNFLMKFKMITQKYKGTRMLAYIVLLTFEDMLKYVAPLYNLGWSPVFVWSRFLKFTHSSLMGKWTEHCGEYKYIYIKHKI